MGTWTDWRHAPLQTGWERVDDTGANDNIERETQCDLEVCRVAR